MRHTVSKTDERQLLDFSIARIGFLGFQEKKKLSDNLDSVHDLALLSIEDISEIAERRLRPLSGWNGTANVESARRAMSICSSLGILALPHYDSDYPEMLRCSDSPPYMLFCRGDVSALCGRSVSVVGTRKLTPQGRKAAFDFAHDAVLDGCCVVSGLAAGADGAAHQGAVAAAAEFRMNGASSAALGKTVAVLPCAADEIVPSMHRGLAAAILRGGGCIISEYEPGAPGAAWRFVARNRIIAALSPATVVIEAPPGSGALITAEFALDSGRDVMFHQAAFTAQAAAVSARTSENLGRKFARGEVSRHKIENTPQKYLDAGAPVVRSYEDYRECLGEPPGHRAPTEQQKLF